MVSNTCTPLTIYRLYTIVVHMKLTNRHGRRRSSAIWMMPEDQFRRLIASSTSVGECLYAFGMENKGRNHHTLRDRIKELGIDVQHFVYHTPSRRVVVRKLEELLVENSPARGMAIKRRLIATGLIDNKCKICGLSTSWQDKPITLVLDHENGDPRDNRLLNIRFLCPNCNSQTPTFAGRNLKRRSTAWVQSVLGPDVQPPTYNLCEECGIVCDGGGRRHMVCFNKLKEKINWPSDELLVEEVKATSRVAVAKRLGVSDRAVGKRLVRIGFIPRKYGPVIPKQPKPRTDPDLSVVTAIANAGRPITRYEIAAAVRMAKQKVGQSINRLIDMGIIFKQQLPPDSNLGYRTVFWLKETSE